MRCNLFFALFTFAFLPHIGEAPLWVTFVAIGLSTHAYLALSGYVARWSLRTTGFLSVMAGAAVFLQFKTLLGPESATAFLILLAALKLEELRTERDGVIFLFLVALLVMYYLLFSQTLLAALYMVVMCLMILVGFVIAHTPREHLKQVLSTAPKLVSKDLLMSLPVFILLFIFFPRFSMPWASRLMGETNVVGFSERLSPGAMASLARSQEPAFRVLFADGIRWPVGTLYWRGVTMTETDGWAWWSSEESKNRGSGTQGRQSSNQKTSNRDSKSMADGDLKYEVHMEPKFGRRLFALERTESLDWGEKNNFNTIRKSEYGTFSTRFPVLSRVAYLGRGPQESAHFNLGTGPVDPLTLRVPEPSPQMRAFVQNLTKKYSSDRQRAEGLLEHFQTGGYRYSLNTPEMKTLDDFFFKEKLGFCEHYASAFASILRWVGVPARVVSGFQGGQYNEFSEFLLVRDQDAHSWVEVYLDGAWQRMDPTYAVNPTRITTGDLALALPGEVAGGGTGFLVRSLAKVQMAFGALEQRFNQFILNYNADAQSDFLPTTWGIKQKRWAMFGLCVLGLILVALFLPRVLAARDQRDPFQALLLNIQNDLSHHELSVRPQDSMTRLMQKAEQRWPDLAGSFVQMEVQYHALRFQRTADPVDRGGRHKSNYFLALIPVRWRSKAGGVGLRELSKNWEALRATLRSRANKTS